MSKGFVNINQITKQSGMSVCCGPLYQRVRDIQKSMNSSKKDLYNYNI